METIRLLADHTIRRACGFALIGVSCIMLAFSYDLAQAFHVGAVLLAGMAVILWAKSLLAPSTPYFRTDLWVMLPDRPKMGKPELQRLIGGILAERFWWHAKAAGAVAGSFSGMSLLVTAIRQF